ncbi:cupin domain-containing protein [Haloferax sp. DFSO52]|uniref:cupin domain-containing protein n=1 Tax=Haloferax sp. DFSO52 TaxID=3388505 RepID=UPI003A8AF4D2
MPRIDFDVERDYDEDRFSAQAVFRSDRTKVICGFFEPGQFIPVHAPSSDLVITVQSGTGLVRDGETDHHVAPGDSIVVPADTNRGIRAGDDSRLEVLLVVTPPPTDEEHGPVRRGLATNEFEPPLNDGQ